MWDIQLQTFFEMLYVSSDQKNFARLEPLLKVPIVG